MSEDVSSKVKKIVADHLGIDESKVTPESKFIDDLIIATSINPLDNKIEDLCIKNKLKFFRGDEEDLLDRFYKAAKKHNARQSSIMFFIKNLFD